MSWARYVLIATQDKKNEILKKLQDYDYHKLISENDGKLLFAYEGRREISVDPDKTLTLSVSDEENYNIEGNPELAKAFSARIELVVGFSIPRSKKENLDNDAKAKKLLAGLLGLRTDHDSDVKYDYLNYRFDIVPDKKTKSLMKNLSKLAEICERLDIEHRIAISDNGYMEVLGDFDDIGLWIGPSAYVTAYWDEHSLIINSADTLFDENNLDFDS